MNQDENLILDELTKKKVSVWKRFATFFTDLILIVGIFIALFFTVGDLTISNVAKSSIGKINEIYASECVKRDVPYKEGTYGIYEVDKDKYIAKIIGTSASYEDAMEKYNNMYYEIDTAIQSGEGYSDAYIKFSATYYVSFLVSAFIPTFVFLFLIPVLNKGRKTIGMLITKTSLAQDKTNVICSGGRVGVRCLSIYAIEFALPYAIGQLLGLGFVIIINILTISLTKKRKGIHDFLTQCHVEKQEFTYTEAPIEE